MTQLGFAVAFPGLPTIERIPGAGERLVLRSARAEYAIGVALGGDARARYRAEVAKLGWSIESETTLRDGLDELVVGNAGLRTRARVVRAPARSFLATFTAARGDDADGATFLDSFEPDAHLERRTVRDVEGGYTVTVPARVAQWEDRAAVPVLRGLSGVVDGDELGVSWVDLAPSDLAAGPKAYFERGLGLSLGELGGTTVTRSDAPCSGYPSVRIEHRGKAVFVTRRVVLAGTRFYDAAVYSPRGTAPAWAAELVDSLAITR